MNVLSAIMGHPWAREVGWVLLHSLWQGAVVGAVFALARHGLRGRGAQVRYAAGCLALLALAAGPVATVWLWPAPEPLGAARVAVSGAAGLALPASGSGAVAASPPGETASWLLQIEAGFCWRLAPWLSAAWALGVAVCLVKLMRGCLWVRVIRRRGTEGVDAAWIAVLNDLRLRLEISRPVRLFKSALVEAPTVIGWLRPVILLPASALTGLTPEQLEAILAHELAHVRRLDCVVNACQCALETLMFYHPAVWWISGCVRDEREHCCDDLVVSVCTNRLAYARALAVLAEFSPASPGLAFAATGRRLLARIRRLVGAEGEPGATGGRQLAGLTLLTVSLPLILVGAWLLLASPVFEATARIKVEREQGAGESTMPSGVPITYAIGYDPYFIQTEFEVIQSELILSKVIEALKLRETWGKVYADGEVLTTQEATRLLKGKMSVHPVRNTTLIEIRARGGDGSEAAELANAVASAYRKYRNEERDKLAVAGLQVLLKQRQELGDQIDRARAKLDQLRWSLKIPDSMATESTPQPQLTAEALRHISSVKLEAELELTRAETLHADLAKLDHDKLIQILPTAVADPLLVNLLEQKNLADQRLILLQQDFGTNQPEVVRARASIADLQNKIQRRVEGIMEALKLKIAAMEQGLTNLNKRVEEVKEEGVRLANQTQPYLDAKRKLEEMVRFRGALETRIEGEKVGSALPKGITVTIVDAAVPPPRAGSPNRPLGGALIGCGVLLDLLGAVLMRARRGA